ncbi:uncharacterized protein LOC135955084 [Calliphora vicina]|uniref:uncharacterized protein LOC135955084 n=1 Tax=Calliphora vicina TaxID=7373 RepID=UPI00325B1A56
MENVPTKFLYKASYNDYKNKSVHFSNTRIAAYFERQWETITTGARIRYFIKPRNELYPIDLNAGYQEYLMTSLYSKHVDLCLKYAMSAEDCKIKNRTKVYTRCGTLVNIMESISSKKSKELSICVTRYNGNIYMTTENSNEGEKTQGDLEVQSPIETHHNQLKRYLFSDSPYNQPNITKPWNENIELLAVFRSNLNKYDIFYSGPVQAIMAKEQFDDFNNMDELNKCRFVLIKQMWNDLENEKQNRKFLRYLFMAHLIKVNDIFVGYKDKKGLVEHPLQHRIVSKLPKHFFNKLSIGEAFLFDFLERVEKLMSNVNCLNTVYVFKIKRNINCIRYQVYEGKTDKTFITKEYIDYCQNENN